MHKQTLKMGVKSKYPHSRRRGINGHSTYAGEISTFFGGGGRGVNEDSV